MPRFLRMKLSNGSELYINPNDISEVTIKSRGTSSAVVEIHIWSDDHAIKLSGEDANNFLALLDKDT